MTEPETGVRLPAACLRACALFAVLAAVWPAAAEAQMLRGSFDTLPGQDFDFSPYSLGPAPDTAFDPPPFEREALPADGAPPPLATPAEAVRRPLPAEHDPYEQLGIRAGAFLLKPSVELTGGYDTNPQSSDPPEGDAFWRIRSALEVESDWVRHAFRGRLEASYRGYDEFSDLDAPDYAADAALRLDARRDLRLDFSFHGEQDSDPRNDPELVGVTGLVENTLVSGRAGLTYKPNRLSIAPTFETTRREFGDPEFEDRNYNSYRAKLRTGYELSPALEPFVEVSANERIYDLDENDVGIEHNSWGWRGYAGARFEPDPIWALEGKIGYGHQEAEDPSMPVLDGVVVAGSLIWRPSELTTFRLQGEKDFAAASLDCCSVTEEWGVTASFEHEFRRWLILTGEVAYDENYYPSLDYTLKNYDAELALEYKFNRTVSAKGRIAYEQLDSSDDSEDYDATIFEIGLRVQR
jgi:hypothetical protein